MVIQQGFWKASVWVFCECVRRRIEYKDFLCHTLAYCFKWNLCINQVVYCPGKAFIIIHLAKIWMELVSRICVAHNIAKQSEPYAL